MYNLVIMVEIVFRPPVVILILAIGVVVVGAAALLFKKNDTLRRIVGFVLVVIVAVAMILFLYRPTTVTVDETGISARGATSLRLTWDQILNAYHEPNLVVSPYRPTVRSRGVALGDFRTGRFLLSNGELARVLMERPDQAVILVTENLTYLFAPEAIEEMVAAINRFRPLPANE